MTMLCIKLGALFLSCLNPVLAEGSFYDRRSEGWFWYNDPPLEEEPQKPEISKEESSPPSASQKLATYKKSLEEKLHTALMDPTYENIEAYMTQQKDMTQRSETFAKNWQRVVLTQPHLNHETVYPTAQYARHVQEDVHRKKKEDVIRSLSNRFGLFYFFKGDCAYCTSFSPIVKMFSEKYDWDVLAVSLDGTRHDLFQTLPNNGMAEELGVSALPALIAYAPDTQELIPVSYAMTSLDRLEDNIMALAGGQG